jgi:hypothetical protein
MTNDEEEQPKMVVVLATARFTIDMADTLAKYFSAFSIDGVVTLEVTDQGLWLVSPHAPARQFLGLADYPTEQTRLEAWQPDGLVQKQ